MPSTYRILHIAPRLPLLALLSLELRLQLSELCCMGRLLLEQLDIREHVVRDDIRLSPSA